MRKAFRYEIAAALAAVAAAHPNHPRGSYAIPWYLVLGEPGTGRSTALRSMNVSWGGDGRLDVGSFTQLCTWWKAREALFIEPEAAVLGQGTGVAPLRDLCDELRAKR